MEAEYQTSEEDTLLGSPRQARILVFNAFPPGTGRSALSEVEPHLADTEWDEDAPYEEIRTAWRIKDLDGYFQGIPQEAVEPQYYRSAASPKLISTYIEKAYVELIRADALPYDLVMGEFELDTGAWAASGYPNRDILQVRKSLRVLFDRFEGLTATEDPTAGAYRGKSPSIIHANFEASRERILEIRQMPLRADQGEPELEPDVPVAPFHPVSIRRDAESVVRGQSENVVGVIGRLPEDSSWGLQNPFCLFISDEDYSHEFPPIPFRPVVPRNAMMVVRGWYKGLVLPISAISWHEATAKSRLDDLSDRLLDFKDELTESTGLPTVFLDSFEGPSELTVDLSSFRLEVGGLQRVMSYSLERLAEGSGFRSEELRVPSVVGQWFPEAEPDDRPYCVALAEDVISRLDEIDDRSRSLSIKWDRQMGILSALLTTRATLRQEGLSQSIKLYTLAVLILTGVIALLAAFPSRPILVLGSGFVLIVLVMLFDWWDPLRDDSSE